MELRKFTAILATGVLAAGLAASSAAASSEVEPADTYKIALIKQHNSNSFQVQVTEAAEEKAAEMGIDLTVLSSEHDAATQISQMSSAFPKVSTPSCSSR